MLRSSGIFRRQLHITRWAESLPGNFAFAVKRELALAQRLSGIIAEGLVSSDRPINSAFMARSLVRCRLWRKKRSVNKFRHGPSFCRNVFFVDAAFLT